MSNSQQTEAISLSDSIWLGVCISRNVSALEMRCLSWRLAPPETPKRYFPNPLGCRNVELSTLHKCKCIHMPGCASFCLCVYKTFREMQIREIRRILTTSRKKEGEGGIWVELKSHFPFFLVRFVFCAHLLHYYFTGHCAHRG
jgi:hypothetical protein